MGYSRAVRVGKVIAVSGTAASDKDGRIVGKGDAYAQTVYIIRKIEDSLKELDADLRDVIRTRIYTTNIEKWEDIARGHREYFGETKPATSMIQVSRLIDPDMLVEIEAEAIRE